jgi:hypothetical protein
MAKPIRLVILLLAIAGCAPSRVPVGDGNDDPPLEQSLFYSGVPLSAVRSDTTRIGHLPIMFQRGTSQVAYFDSQDGSYTPVRALLREMNAYLDSIGIAERLSVRLIDGSRASVVMATESRVLNPPDISFGCFVDALRDECADRDGPVGRRRTPVRLTMLRPSPAFTDWTRDLMSGAGVGRALLITLEVGQYMPRQTGLTGKKQVELGTGHLAKLPWLTSVDLPVTVLQLTGALMSGDGRAIRTGAQGLYVRPTRLLFNPIGAQTVVEDKDVEATLTSRREDIAGNPLVWRVALRELVGGLTGRAVSAP